MVNKVDNLRILVIGDSCEDIFCYGEVNRLAPEGPAPVFNSLYVKSNGGMSKNVQANIQALGINCDIITNHEKVIKKRFIDDRTNTLLLRHDENDKVERINQEIIKSIRNNLFQGNFYNAIVISDYCKGFLNEYDIKILSKNNRNTFLDTKKIIGTWASNTSFIKINHVEYARTKHTIDSLDIDDKLIITCSGDGCIFKKIKYPVEKVNIKDVSGAGDTFIAGLVVEYCKSLNIENAIKFAQECATKVVQKKGVCTI